MEEPDGHIGCIPGFGAQERHEPAVDPADSRKDNFRPFDHGICGGDICAEAGRCLQCDLRLKIAAPRLWGDFAGAATGKEG